MPAATIAPSAVRKPQRVMARRASKPSTVPSRAYLFNRSVRSAPLRIKRASAQTLHLENGWNVLDASGGAAVTGIGHLNTRVEQAMIKTIQSGLSYVSSMMFDTDITETFARFLINTTDGKMSKVVFYSSGKPPDTTSRTQLTAAGGTEANEAAFKLALQYHATEKANPEPTRKIFIARDRSYHGTTLWTLDMGGHKARREPWERVLPNKTTHISPCYAYRGLQTGETKVGYVTRLANELETEIQRHGPQNVAAFICEPVVGAVSQLLSKLLFQTSYGRQTGYSARRAVDCSFVTSKHHTDTNADLTCRLWAASPLKPAILQP